MFSRRFYKFAGLDFSCDETQVSYSRSPDAINMIPDESGAPEKRVGYRKIKTYEGEIHGIYALNDKIITHSGDKIYLGDEVLISGINPAKSTACVFEQKLWILTGREFLVFDGERLEQVSKVAYVPQVLSQCDNYLKNGFTYQSFNMLTNLRRVGITVPDGGMNIIYIDQEIDPATVSLFYRDSGEEIPVKNVGKTAEGTYYIDLQTSISASKIPDEVILQYGLATERERILEKCTFLTVFDNRLFLGGNPDYPNTDFHSETADGTYFTDLSYTGIGTMDEKADGEFEPITDGKIIGYSHLGNCLCIHKKSSDASLYLRSRQITDAGAIYPITEGIVGGECVSASTIATLNDDPMYLTPMGVFAIGSKDVTGERCVRARSSRINPKLTREKCLEKALTCTYNGYFMLFINGRVYLADSRQKSYPRNESGDFEYEWYLWDNFPATAVYASETALYFGDAVGNLYRLNDDMVDDKGGYLMRAYNDDGKPIFCRWSTKMDDDNDFTTEKIMLRRGSGIYAKTYAASSINIRIRTERDFGIKTKSKKLGIFSFKNLDFANLTFNTYPFAFIPLGRKIKNYRMVQVIAENGELNQCMGITAIEWHYKKGGFAK